MDRRCTLALLCLAAIGSAGPVEAAQSLIPTPYPSAAPGAMPLDPETPSVGGGQQIMKDPYPQTAGPNSQGNPPTTRNMRRGQRLVPSINQRKYRVDEPAR